MTSNQRKREALTRTQFLARWLWRGFALPLIAVLVVALLSLAYFSWEFCEVCYQFHFEFSAVELSVFSIAGIILGLAPTYQALWLSERPPHTPRKPLQAATAWIIGVLCILPILAIYIGLDRVSGPHPV